MKVVLVPILKILMILIAALVLGFVYIVASIIQFIWEFKCDSWSDHMNDANKYKFLDNHPLVKKDKNIVDSIKRWWKLDFYW